MQLRPVSRSTDLGALNVLFEMISECDGHPPIGEHKYLDLLHAEDGVPTGLVGCVGTELVAYVAVRSTRQTGTWAMEVAAHPLHRSRSELESMIDAGVARVSAKRGRRIRVWAFQPNLVEALEAAGFVPERELRQLRRALPAGESPLFPDGTILRGFRPGVDDADWIRVNNAAFAGHPENGAWTQEILDDRKRQPWFDAEGFRMAWLGEELIGFCWTKLHRPDLGEIYVIAVSPSRRGHGWGRLLTLEGMRHLWEVRHTDEVMLYVDADNHPALGLYAALGFRLDHVDRSLVRTL